jgi:hypothetical protein
MPSVQDAPRPVRNPAHPTVPGQRPAGQPLVVDPQQGVIEEARRRQRQRRIRVAIATVIVVGLIALVLALLEAANANSAHTGLAGRGRTAGVNAGDAPAFNVRLAPTLEVGQAGWQVFEEEHGRQTGGEGVGPALSSDPIVAAGGAGAGGSRIWTTRVTTTSNVAAILVDGKTRVPTVPLPGLPYGFRGASIVTPVTPAEERIAPGVVRGPQGPRSLVPLNPEGQPISYKPSNVTPFQGRLRRWEYPAPTPRGSCGLGARPMPGLTAEGGKVLGGVRPYPTSLVGGQIVGHAFLPCVSVEYHLQGMPLRGLVLLDAAHPCGRVAALPDFEPVSGEPGFVDEGGLTARRDGNAWLVVGQGSGVAQRVELLRRLSAFVNRHSPVLASSGVREVGEGSSPPPPAGRVASRDRGQRVS